jgi:hypothetical protein
MTTATAVGGTTAGSATAGGEALEDVFGVDVLTAFSCSSVDVCGAEELSDGCGVTAAAADSVCTAATVTSSGRVGKEWWRKPETGRGGELLTAVASREKLVLMADARLGFLVVINISDKETGFFLNFLSLLLFPLLLLSLLLLLLVVLLVLVVSEEATLCVKDPV